MKNKLTDTQKIAIQKQTKAGIPADQLARRYGVSARAIYHVLGARREMPRLSDEERDLIAKLRETHTQRATAEITGRGRTTIQRLESGGSR